MDFSPVLGLKDNIAGCRAFTGDYKTIAKYGKEYIKGLQDNGIVAVAKHYPGEALSGNDLHYSSSNVTITQEDLYPFNYVKGEAKAIMVSHQIVSGVLNSNGMPSDTSTNIVSALRSNFKGLIITDDVNMPSITYYYTQGNYTNRTRMYADLIKSGDDMIIDFDNNLTEINDALSGIKTMVQNGNISKARIDDSVKRILTAKGYKVTP
jgi:beta-glucosidase-like glycosyl hydrolase